MKIIVLSVRVLVIVLCVSLVMSSVRKVHTSVCSVCHLLIDTDEVLSSSATDEIRTAISLMQRDDGTYNPASIVQTLPKQFASLIKSVSIQSVAYNTAHIVIGSFEPLAKINADYVLTEHGCVVSAAQFTDEVLAMVPPMQIVATTIPTTVSDQVLATVTHCIHEGMSDHYLFVLVSDHELRLHDKSEPRFSIVCDPSHAPEKEMIERCEHLKKQLVSDAATPANSKALKCWKADIRFHDQIVVSQEQRDKRGEHGTYV